MGIFSRVLMCAPKHFRVVYNINPWMGGKVNPVRAQEQWDALKKALENTGLQVSVIEPHKDLPDMVFACNGATVYGRKAFIPNFQPAERRGEQPIFAEWFQKQGYKVIEDKSILNEGSADAIFVAPDKYFAGFGVRTQKGFHDRLVAAFSAPNRQVRAVPCEMVSEKFYHLDTCFNALDSRTALYFPPAFTSDTVARLKKEVPDLIEVSSEDAHKFACNLVAIEQKHTVIMPEGSRSVPEAIRQRGWKVIELPMDEFLKSGGAVHCLVLKLYDFDGGIEE